LRAGCHHCSSLSAWNHVESDAVHPAGVWDDRVLSKVFLRTPQGPCRCRHRDWRLSERYAGFLKGERRSGADVLVGFKIRPHAFIRLNPVVSRDSVLYSAQIVEFD
jgi:hypothetical protein